MNCVNQNQSKIQSGMEMHACSLGFREDHKSEANLGYTVSYCLIKAMKGGGVRRERRCSSFSSWLELCAEQWADELERVLKKCSRLGNRASEPWEEGSQVASGSSSVQVRS